MKRKDTLVKVISLLVISFGFGHGQEPTCCLKVKGPCAVACKQLSLAALASESGDEAIERMMRPIRAACSLQLSSFWQCMNDTRKDLFQGSNWEGRYCCSMAQTRQCQSSCFTAQQSSDLKGKCRRGDESAVYQCLERQEEFETCCGQSGKAECVAACKIFLREPPQQSRRNGVRKRFNVQCEKETPVLSCVANLTHVSPVHNSEKNLPCCARGRNFECQEACRKALKSASSEQAALETLVEKGCGHPRPDDQMWQCFLQNAEPKGTDLPSKIDRLGIDAAKLHCCHRAINPNCRRLCHNTYSREWTGSWSDLDQICLSSPAESALRACVEEVEEPCELGCEGLTFCSAFNNRPSELFRRCNPIADTAARHDFEAWKSQGYIPLSDTMKLPLNFGLGQCVTEKWKAVACALQLKPCHPRTHASQICRSDCVSLLHECVDFDRLSLTGGHDVTSICELLSPPPGSQCISISSYTQSRSGKNSAELGLQQDITRPCRNRPCNTTEMCHVNRNYESDKGKSFTCQSGCSLGEVSKLIVSPGTWVRVPVQQGPGCQRLCRCGDDGRMEKCATSTVCDAPAPCWLGRNHIEHGSNFWLECNLCSCRSGELICSKRQCASQEETGFLFSSSKVGTEVALPCNCPSIRTPVCGSNGRTYSSSCLAKCGGLSETDITLGECAAIDPCEGVKCGVGRRCIRTRRVCLLPSSRKCPQFQCVPLKCEETWHKAYQPVCDTEGRQHRNLCTLSTAGAMLAYYGPCFRSGCSSEGPICGIDGETYSSECAAEAQGIPKDYNGPCQFIGTGDGYHLEQSCSGKVECPPLPPNCMGVTPSGACCPICGGVLRIVYSPTQVQKLSETTDSQLISVDDIANRLSSLVQTAQCRTGVYLGLGTELVVVVKPVAKTWTKVQIQACVSETERLVTLISQQSPVIQVDAALSVLTAASMNHVVSGVSSLSPVILSGVSWTFIAVILAMAR